MHKKKIISSTLVTTTIVVLSTSLGVFAGSNLQEIKAYLNGDIKFEVKGSAWAPKDLEGNMILPITYNGTTYVPLRAISDALNTSIEYDSNRNMVIVGDNEKKNPTNVNTTTKTNEINKIDVVLKAFRDDGFTVGEKEEQFYQLIGAVDGVGVNINGIGIELYLYDSKDIEKVEEEMLNESAILNGNVMLVFPTPIEHPDKNRIIEVFKSVKGTGN
ncbi:MULTISPECIES: stalk domain-containing protein [unclassified Paenibacillus]|uniref:stalk domain-containing protein n=1 Tax=unclassified Paenibacillus TaxID=185978 RepID=UPI0027882F3A|nr:MULTISPECIES: stalk domain-containing protein [unclassified Paenibacillus]MDQ0896417.1 hypothetical protein [Paenibacillus sp. V4I7]MDQ0914039.1 hypothetical protein [Paenibacillus sp. V4I5]